MQPVPYDGSEVTWRISVYGLVVKDNALLLAKSSREELFDVIGGGVDIGETLEEALEREAIEEGGVKVKMGKLLANELDWFYHRVDKKFYQTIQIYYLADFIETVGKPTDPYIEFAEFIPFEKLSEYPVLPVVTQVIQEHLLHAKRL